MVYVWLELIFQAILGVFFPKNADWVFADGAWRISYLGLLLHLVTFNTSNMSNLLSIKSKLF